MVEKKDIEEKIKTMSGKYSVYQIFYDWVKMFALSIQNGCTLLSDKLKERREKEYLEIAMKYTKEEMKGMCQMSGMLSILIEKEFNDWLGAIYMGSGCGSKNTGQFFTPYHLSRMTAKTAVNTMKNEEEINVMEPSAGAGGMIIALADTLDEIGIDYQKKLKVVARDLDWLAVYMTYVQLSLYGIDAAVIQGDALNGEKIEEIPKSRVLLTPRRMGMLI